MGAGGSEINRIIRDCVADEGFPYDFPFDFFDLTDEAFVRVSTGTTPVVVLSSDWSYLSWAAANVDATYLRFHLPRSLALKPSKTAATLNIPYAQLRVSLSAYMPTQVGPDTPGFTVTAKARSKNGAIKATFTAVFVASASGATTNALPNSASVTNPTELVYDFFETNGTGPVYLAPGDSIEIKIVPGTHANDAIQLHGLRVSARVNAGFTAKSDLY